jgi:hypothetical protein
MEINNSTNTSSTVNNINCNNKSTVVSDNDIKKRARIFDKNDSEKYLKLYDTKVVDEKKGIKEALKEIELDGGPGRTKMYELLQERSNGGIKITKAGRVLQSGEDGRKVNELFDKEVRSRLLYKAITKVFNSSNKSDSVGAGLSAKDKRRKVISIVYSAVMIKLAATESASLEQFKDDIQIKELMN